MSNSSAGKVAIVTGASRGIGRATALELANRGHNVAVVVSRDLEGAASVAETIRAGGREAASYQCDVGDRAQVERMFDGVLETFGRIDVVVNNAVFSVRKPLIDLTVEDMMRTLAVSQLGVFHCSQLAARQMIKQGGGGSIVVISSIHGSRPYPNASAYNGVKAAVAHMAQTWAVELVEHNIRVNVVEPGWTDTPGERLYYSEEFIQTESKKLPMKRLATPEEIAKSVAYLVSGDASYVTGSVLTVDGGLSLVR